MLLSELLNLGKEDVNEINYNNTIYRIMDESCWSKLIIQMATVWQLNHLHEIDRMIKSKMFYVENCDLQTIYKGEDLEKDYINDGYTIIDVYDDKVVKFKEALSDIYTKYEDDPEGCHVKMDNFLIETLKDEGYDTSVFENAYKWYA